MCILDLVTCADCTPAFHPVSAGIDSSPPITLIRNKGQLIDLFLKSCMILHFILWTKDWATLIHSRQRWSQIHNKKTEWVKTCETEKHPGKGLCLIRKNSSASFFQPKNGVNFSLPLTQTAGLSKKQKEKQIGAFFSLCNFAVHAVISLPYCWTFFVCTWRQV